MRSENCVLAVDQGTSSTKALLVDGQGAVMARAAVPIAQQHPRPGWAEQDAEEIWASALAAVEQVLADAPQSAIVAVGLSTQRESTVLWDRATGRPVGPVLGWQDNRGAVICARLRDEGHSERVRRTSGLPLDSMFSASKAAWLLEAHDPDGSRSRAGDLCLGTIDSWLLSRLGEDHLIEVGNASRTMLLDIGARDWDPWLLDRFGVPREVLPRVVASNGPFPDASRLHPRLASVPVTAVLGDSHAALFAHGGWRPGTVKATYGTGSSVMGLATGDARPAGLACSIAWETSVPSYAVEGNIRSSGATLTWLAELFGTDPATLADSASDSSEGVTLVPAFTGLGSPWWDDSAQAMLTGFTFGTRREHLARAALESIVFQVEDVVAEVAGVAGAVTTLLVDGGASGNSILMQLQADISHREVVRAEAQDLSAVGAAHLAGMGVGSWTLSDLESLDRAGVHYRPALPEPARLEQLHRWREAVATARRKAARPVPSREKRETDA